MIFVFVFCLLFLLLSAVGVGTKGKFALSKSVSGKSAYCSREMTASVNGYFLTTVFMTHIIQYLDEFVFNQADLYYLQVNKCLGQLIVAMFLFYSGYGIMESIRQKEGYIRSFPGKRILPFVVYFEVAALIYLVFSCAMGNVPTVGFAIKTFFAWETLGNSNWYVFAIMYLYLATYVVFRCMETKIFKKMPLIIGVAGVVFFSFVYILWMRHAGKGGWWYDTILCYSTGMLFSLCRKRVEKIISGSLGKLYYIGAILILTGVFAYFYQIRLERKMFFIILSAIFSVLIVLLTMSFRGYNRVYCYIGKNLFPFYIYQRLPMIFFKNSLAKVNAVLYLFVCAIFTAMISFLMIRFYRWLKKYLP